LAKNGSALLPTLKVTGFGKSSPKLTFQDCAVGVRASGYNLDEVSDCRMEKTLLGVWASNGRDCVLKVQRCSISTGFYGMLFDYCPYAKEFRIFNNEVNFPQATGWGQSGIALLDCSPVKHDEYEVEMNTVKARGTFYGGIHLNASWAFRINNNTINLYNTQTETAGINVEGGGYNKMLHNHCFGSDATAKAGNRISGIHTSMTTLPVWCCNDVHSIKNGVFVEGNCMGNFYGNMMDDHSYGLRFGNSGPMGPQIDDQGNTWSGSAGSIWQAWHEGGAGIASLSPFKVKQNSAYEAIPANPKFIGGISTKWFAPPINSNLDPFDCSQSVDCSNNSAALSPVEDSIAIGSFTIPYHTDGSIWAARRNLYARLSRTPALAQSGSNMAAFVTANQNGEIGRLESIAQGEEGLFHLTLADAATAANYTTTTQSLMAQMVVIDTLLVAAPDSAQQGLLAQKAALQVQYAANRQAAASFWESHRQQAYSAADQLLAQNEAITTTTLQGANEKIWRRIQLAKLLRGDFNLSAVQVANLESVAYQCPLDGGGVVYAARAALETIQGWGIAWPDNCAQSLQEEEGEDRSNLKTGSLMGYRFFPNPVSDMLTVDVPESVSERSLEVTGILGNITAQLTLSNKRSMSRIPLEGMASGVYWLVIREKGKVVFSSKVIKF